MSTPAAPPGASPTISVGAVLFGAIGVVYLVLRMGAASELPVAGPELDGLAGAWQAQGGHEDDRFTGTVAQQVHALTLLFTTSETPARWLSVAESALVLPLLWLLRRRLGVAAVLATMLILALDPTLVQAASAATPYSWDVPVALGLVVWLLAGRPGGVSAAFAAGLAVAGSGPLPLFAAAAWAIGRVTPATSARVVLNTWAGASLAGASVAIALGSVVGGVELRVPPLEVMAQSASGSWATGRTLDLVTLYGLPQVVAGTGLAGLLVYRRASGYAWREFDPALLTWLGLSGAWLALSLGDHSPAPLVALAVPVALAAGSFVGEAVRRLLDETDWLVAGFGLVSALVFAALGTEMLFDWARLERVGPASEQFRLSLYFSVAVLLLAGMALWRETAAALIVPAAIAWVGLGLPAAMSVAVGSATEPLISPASAEQGGLLRDLSVAARVAKAGPIVIHPSLERDITWPFRDSGQVLIASRVPDGASIVLWPTALPQPDGLKPLDGKWTLTRTLRAPTADMLDYLRWLFDRNTLASRPVPIAVYTPGDP